MNKSEISLYKPGIFNQIVTVPEVVSFLWQETCIIFVLSRFTSDSVTTET